MDAFNNGSHKLQADLKAPVLGLHKPNMFSNAFAVHQLVRIPGLKVVTIVCDPLGRFEKLFYFRFCHAAHLAAGRGPGEASAPPPCSKSIAEALGGDGVDPAARKLLQTEGFVWPHLEKVARIFSQRLLVVYQGHLCPELYRVLATTLGASGTFPAQTRFARHNSIRGDRTNLCRNRSLVRALQLHLARDYRTIRRFVEASGAPAASALRRWRTRCDDPAELGALDTSLSKAWQGPEAAASAAAAAAVSATG
eukprot:TRINITY_DN58958_c0_g1_i1.p1 TRINITY_DN58958_c0_g1~~TRINITY_DN58958_c0_g1_i1.p1  ORF type:complete len:282 (+),score=46.93 TRINITY_DN58958_c0_g1_i1:91-846(+)